MQCASKCRNATLCGVTSTSVVGFISVLLFLWYKDGVKCETQSSPASKSSSENVDYIEDLKLLDDMNNIIHTQRKIIREEMEGFPYPNGDYNVTAGKLEDLLIEENGNPIRSIIVSNWRSGTSFLGGIVNAHPGNFYHFEPLSDFGVIVIRGPPLAERAIERAKALLRCDFTNSDANIGYEKIRSWTYHQNTRYWKQCQIHEGFCYDKKFLNAMCKLFPFQSVKFTRLRLSVAKELLADEELAVKMIFLVRDPRGAMRSRNLRSFCRGSPDCLESTLLCADLISDYKTAVELRQKYPGRFRVIRYEDLAADPYQQAQEITEFFGRYFHPNVRKFLDDHTKTDLGGPFDMTRNTKETPYRWKAEMDFEEVEEIQRNCVNAMKYWGYVPATNSTHQREFNPVTNYNLYNDIRDL